MWFDLIAAARTLPEKTDRQPNTVLVGLWKALQPEQQFRYSPAYHPYYPSAPGIQSCLGVTPTPQVYVIGQDHRYMRSLGVTLPPHVEITTCWFHGNKQRVKALVNSGDVSTLTHGDPQNGLQHESISHA